MASWQRGRQLAPEEIAEVGMLLLVGIVEAYAQPFPFQQKSDHARWPIVKGEISRFVGVYNGKPKETYEAPRGTLAPNYEVLVDGFTESLIMAHVKFLCVNVKHLSICKADRAGNDWDNKELNCKTSFVPSLIITRSVRPEAEREANRDGKRGLINFAS
ncbi:hypothetical protein H4Q26_018177 [Puccinia striiformis f. sp. tritici PST-130]|nr:hypothetical protein H4Q26_018177 [Puccinia striiformis f. sp. tritici PST-130]